MKALLFIIPLAGAALLASAGEPAKTNAPSASATQSPAKESPMAPAGNLDAVDKAFTEKVAERIVNSEAITVKPLRSASRSVGQLFNPFAPLERAPDTTWLSRAPWSDAAESAAKGSAPVEMRHEAQFGVMICGK